MKEEYKIYHEENLKPTFDKRIKRDLFFLFKQKGTILFPVSGGTLIYEKWHLINKTYIFLFCFLFNKNYKVTKKLVSLGILILLSLCLFISRFVKKW